ncbi:MULTISPECIES: 3-hydroxyacyl-ACP dehydratase FabZ [unclassified Halanaerobium]|uniref:3-hydroxyacyl-ACP dehydratase FabZ n=1 Tax=unclassified Halanaerobium TaxID=2641197 RepID=UPI000E135C9C|nr:MULTISPECIES: 3-hydroxyacyl-ACP dehydratase FabZ [unclassified Halanaerobium]RCW48241.1 3-hydroxyacyl-[acyl-carrier-protein] dehydratase [Halanaerobium sp. MA284_MarDTE_T2]RCW85668.1 3-hydroxyacyl-[acyl-carrier-protein] dehydratase [Halanaerobium sp. DL-01]
MGDINEIIDINKIRSILPHRYPLLLVDKIEELQKGEHVVGIKNVTINEEFFLGHYPDHPIMPGVLIVEAMAQVAGVLIYYSFEDMKETYPYLTGIDKAKFRTTVVPGDRLVIKVDVMRLRSKISKVRTEAYVEDRLAAEAELMFAFEAE